MIECLCVIFNFDEFVFEVICDELFELKDKYGDECCMEIFEYSGDISIEDMIVDEDMVIMVINFGYIKCLLLVFYCVQNCGGKGCKGMEMKEEDFVENVFVVLVYSYILVVIECGQFYWIKVYGIFEMGLVVCGKVIVNLFNFDVDECIVMMIVVWEFLEDFFFIFVIEGGMIKKMSFLVFLCFCVDGIIVVCVDEDDCLFVVCVIDGSCDIVLVIVCGYVVCFLEIDV